MSMDIDGVADAALADLRQRCRDLEAEVSRLRGAITTFVTHEDTHVEGRVINDGYYEGPICADCELYWPCPTEELRRVVGAT